MGHTGLILSPMRFVVAQMGLARCSANFSKTVTTLQEGAFTTPKVRWGWFQRPKLHLKKIVRV